MNHSGNSKMQGNSAHLERKGDDLAMMRRSLQYRLRRPQDRFAPATEPVHIFVIEYVDANGEVTSRLTLGNGEQKWWYAPGHEPENPEMSSGVRR